MKIKKIIKPLYFGISEAVIKKTPINEKIIKAIIVIICLDFEVTGIIYFLKQLI